MKSMLHSFKFPAFLFLLFFMGTSIGAFAQTLTWRGTTNTDWNTNTNWNPATVPGAGSTVIIPVIFGATLNNPILTGSGACKELRFTGSATLSGSGTLSMGATSSTPAVLINSFSGTHTISCNIDLVANTEIRVSTALNISGTMTGGGNLNKTNSGPLNLSGTATSFNTLGFANNGGTVNLSTGTSTFDAINMASNTGITMNGDATVNGSLSLNSGGSVVIGSNTLTVNGGIVNAGSGILAGSSLSNLVLGGATGSAENLYFGGIGSLHNLILNHSTAKATTTLFTNLDIYGGITFLGNKDELDLNGSSYVTTLKSDANGTAFIGNLNNATLNGATNVTIERYIPANGFRSWRLLSVPTYGSGQTIRQAWQEGDANNTSMSSPGNTVVEDNNPGFGTQITLKVPPGYTSTDVNNAYNAGFDSVTYNTAFQLYNNSSYGFNNVTNTATTPIETTSGYFLYVRGERTKGVTGLVTDESATTLRTNGTVYQGTITSPSIAANKYAVIGNVYASRIDFSSLSRTGGVDNAFYVWDSKIQSGSSLGAYQTFSGTNGYLCPIGGGSYTPGVTNTTIESGQAFFVHTTGSVGTISLTESSKTGLGSTLGLRPATPTSQLVKIDSRLYSLAPTGTTIADANVVVFNNIYSNNIDGDDAYKFSNAGENFGIKRTGGTLVIEGRQALSSKDTIFFNMWNMQKQQYKLEFEPMNLSSFGYIALLQDNYLNTDTPVDLSANTTVNFTVDANAGSAAANRFRIVFAPGNPLPVSFLSVAANPAGSGVKVDWKVAGEVGLLSYEVERSTDGRNFVPSTFVKATGNSTIHEYSWTDLNVPAGQLFYRIKSIGVAGEIKYSTTVKVNRGNAKESIVISPNPVDGGAVNLQFSNKVKGNYSIRISNIAGQSILSTVTNHTGGNSNHVLVIPAGLKTGTYLLEITAPDRAKTAQKLIYHAN